MRQKRVRAEVAGPSGSVALEDSTIIATLAVAEGGEIVAVNNKTRELLGAPSQRALCGMNLRDLLVDPADWRAWESVFGAGAGCAVTHRLRKPDGAEITLRGDLRPAEGGYTSAGRCVIGTFVDLTREQQLTRAVQQSARMEALGSLTAGVAHDFNNLLTVLVGNLSLLAEEVRAEDKLFGKIKPARDAAKRGADLIRQLLTFARREEADVGVIDVGRVVADLEPLLKRALGARITFETAVEAGQWPVRASTAQLESVIVNLAVNARDAITGRGNVTVAVGEAVAEQGGRRSGPRQVAIRVTDDGCGIPPDLLDRVFEPFFSTKVERGGTGLGLTMVRWFAEGVHGAVRATSTVGKGTTVTLLLPHCAEAQIDPTAGTTPLSTLPAGKERVLVVASEEGVRSTISQILEVLGYTVHATQDPGSVVTVLQAYAAELLIVDAQVCGREARPTWMEAALGRRPGMRVMMTSDGPLPEFAAALGAVLLAKPFALAELAKTVRRTLDRGTGRPSERAPARQPFP